MSIEAYAWVTHDAPPPGLAARAVLYALADYAGHDGRGAYPSSKTLAVKAAMDASNVRRCLRELEAGGWIRRGNPAVVAHLPKGQRPTVWELNLALRDPDRSVTVTETPGHGDTPVTTTPVTVTGDPGHGDPQTVIEPSVEPSLNRTPCSPPPGDATAGGHDGSGAAADPAPARKPAGYSEAFERWWSDYPRKDAKKDAYRAWTKAVKTITADELHARLLDRLPELNAREPRYRPMPATWLNGGRYDDPVKSPEPDRADAPDTDTGFAGAHRRLLAKLNGDTAPSPSHIDCERLDIEPKEINSWH